METKNVDQYVGLIEKYTPIAIDIAWKLVILLVIWFLGGKILNLILNGIDKIAKRRKMDESIRKFLIIFLRCAGDVLLIFAMLEYVGVGTTSAVAVLGSAGLAIGLALQGSLSNFAGGIVILAMKPFKIGDYIITNGVEGTVKLIGLIYTTIMTVDNVQIVVPNGKLADSTITNVSTQSKRKVIIKVGISYGADLKKAKDVLHELVNNDERVVKKEEITIFVAELADSSVVLETRYWVNAKDFLQAKWDMIEAIKLTFDEKGIEIPFNQLDVHMR